MPTLRQNRRVGCEFGTFAAIVEMKTRNAKFGYLRIAQQISHAFGVEIDKDVVRRVLAKHCQPSGLATEGPSWLTFFAQSKDSLFSVDSGNHVAGRLVDPTDSFRPKPLWFGFPFELHRPPSSGHRGAADFTSYWLAVIVTGGCSVRLQTGTRERELSFSAGSFSGYPVGRAWDNVHYRGAMETMNISCDWRHLRNPRTSTLEDKPSLNVMFRCAADRSIMAIATNMIRESETGCMSGRIYAEALSLALMARLEGFDRELIGSRKGTRGFVLPPTRVRLSLNSSTHRLDLIQVSQTLRSW